MSLDANDPRLTDYVLGELSAEEHAEIETALADSPELERAVEEIRATCELLAHSLQNRPALALTDGQHAAIKQKSTDAEPATVPLPKTPARRSRSKLFLLATVASLLVAVSIGVMMKLGPFRESQTPYVDDFSTAMSVAPPGPAKSRPTVSPYRTLIQEEEADLFRSAEAGRGSGRNEDGGFLYRSANTESGVTGHNGQIAVGGGVKGSEWVVSELENFNPLPGRSGRPVIGTITLSDDEKGTISAQGHGGRGEGGGRPGGKNGRDIDDNVTLATIPDDDGPSVSFGLGPDGQPTADMDIKVAEARLQELAGKWKEEIRSGLKRKTGGESVKVAQIREKYFELRDAIHKSERLADARKLPESSTGKKLAKLDKSVREADKLFATKPARSWRRVKATPNASRMMIGNHEELPLQGMQANVQIDGFRARVLLDYYYYNDRQGQFAGNFKLRLPNEASLYFFAFGDTAYTYRPPSAGDKDDPQMRKAFFNVKDVRGAGYRPDEILKLRADTWKAPKVARIVPREKAAFAYRETRFQKIDPALVEWSGAGVFSAKVFPLMPKKLHRIVIGYDVDLTKLGDDLIYTLDLPEGVSETAVDVNLAAVAGESAEIEPAVKPFTAGGRAYFNINRPGKQVSVRIKQPGNTLLVGKDGKAGDFFAASVKADLPDDKAAVNSPYGVFLLDTSLSSNPDKFNVYLKLLRAVLNGNRDTMRQFAVLTFNVEAHWWERKFVDNTPKNVDRLMAYCHTLSLEGATDLAQAVRQAARPEWFAGGGRVKNWDVFLLSDGGLNWGERNLLTLSKTLSGEGSLAGSMFAYHTGMSGTASRVLTHLTRETGGAVFTAKNDDAVADAAKAHRKRPWQLEGVELAGGEDLLLAGRPRTIYPGQDLLLVGRGTPAKDASVQLKVRRGEETKTLSVKLTRRIESELAARTYGHVATGQLESLGSLTEDMSVAYARHFRITGQTCSLLMLETEADYKRFNIKPEDDSLLVQTSLAGAIIDKKISEAMTVLTNPKEGFTRWLARLEKMPGMEFRVSPALRVALDNLPPEAFEVPHARLRAKHRTWEGMSDELKEKLSLGKVDYDMLQKEAQRRMSKYGEADAMVALSSLIENSPGNLVLARDVAYSAIDWGLNDQAYHLLHRVAMARPYEPQMYLAMAQSLAQAGKNDLALLYYEVVSSGKWNNRFRDFGHIVAVDYLHFLRQIDAGERKLALKEYAKARLDRVKDTVKLDKADLLVTVMWNTDGTDVDLHIKEPTGEVCFYQNRKTRIGGQITQDCTQGFGPELYTLPTARHGKYDIQVKYFARDTNRASGRTRVLATIYEGWGTKQERVIRKAVTLTTGKQMHAVATVGIEK